MVGKNNRFLKENKNNQRFLRFSLRKLSVGVVSVAIAAGFYVGGSQSVLADTTSTDPVVRQNAPNDDSTVNTDKNTVNQQSASTSADSSAVAGAADSTAAEAVNSAAPAASSAAEAVNSAAPAASSAAEAGNSAAPAASSATEAEKSAASAVEQQKMAMFMAMFNVAKEKSAATSNTANLLGKKVKVRSYAASDTAKAEEDQLADKLLKNIKISDPTDSNFARYQGYVDKYNNQTTDTSSQYVFSVIRDHYGYDFIWTIDRDTGSKVFVYLAAKNGRGYEEIKGYALPSDGGNFSVGEDGNIILNYTPKTGSESGSINVADQDGNHLTAVYGLGTQVKSSSSYGSIAELLPEKGQPIIKFLYKDPNSDGKLVNLRKPIYCKEGLTGQSFVLDTSNYANDISDYTKNDKAFDGFTLEPNKNNDDNKIFEGTFTQFDQGKTYVKYYTSDDSEVIYQQLDASGTMKVDYYKDVHSDEGPRFVGSIDRLEAGKSQKIIDDATGGTMTVRNPFVSGSYSYEFIYTPDPQTGKIIYQDANNNNVEVDHTDLKGKTTQDIDVKGQINVPTNWKIVPGQKIPDTVKATADGIPTVKVNIEHDTITVNPGDPKKPSDKLPDGTNYPAGVDQNDLNHDVVRTINITKPDKTTTTTTQKTSFNRTATIDLVDHSIKYGNWVQQGDNGWKKVDVPVVDGYTPSVQNIDKVAVTPDTEDATIDVTYTANDQSLKITYVDKDDNPVDGGIFNVSGKTDQTVDTKAKIPAGWVLEDGQTDAPKTITFTGTPTADITIKIEHGKTSVDHTHPVKPGDKTPSGKEIKGAHDEDLNQTITRTVNITEPGQATKTTTQVAHIYRDATVDDVTGEVVTYSAWSTDSADWTAVNVPSHAGYTAHQSDGQTGIPVVTVKDGQKDVNIDVTYTPDEQKGQITYVDEKGNQISSTPLTGKTDQDVDVKGKINVPTNWELVPGQTIPDTVKATANGIPTVTVNIEHDTITVNPGDPKKPSDKLPDGTNYPAGVDQNDLNHDVVRTINITKPGKTTTTTTQKTSFNRTATIDLVDHSIKYGNWVQQGDNGWKKVDVPVVDGYTPSVKNIDKVAVTPDTKDATIDVTYTANAQTGAITYVDREGNTIDTTPLTGKTDDNVTINPVAPAGWKIIAGQQIPTTVKATANGIQGPSILVEHDTTTVKPGDLPNPGDKKPGNPDKKPGDKTPKTDITYNDLHKAMTRTINVTDPHTGLKTTKVTLNYERTATIDDVTGKVTYGNWTVAEGSKAGFDGFNVPAVPGYTSEIKSGSAADLKALTPNQDQITNWTDQTVDIDYTANDQSLKITYVDKDDNPVDGGIFNVSGKTDQTVDTKAKIPAGWVLEDGQTDAPKTITFTGTPTADITIKIEHGKTSVDHTHPVKPGDKTPSGKEIKGAHDEDLNQTITRTVNITEPGQATKTTTQVAHIYRDATVDDVTGEVVTYSAWSTDSADWTAVNVPSHAGYTAHQSDGQTGIPVVTVKDGQKDVNIDVTYTPDEQKGQITYVDEKGNQISSTPLTGKTDQDVDVKGKINVPTNWELVPGQTIPDTVKATANGIPTVTVNIEHDTITVNPGDPKKPSDKLPDGTNYPAGVDQNDLNHDVVRTINITKPGKTTTTTTQKTSFNRTATIDLVDHSIKYGNWVQQGDNGWKKVDVPVVDGYTPSVKNIDKVAVTPDTKDATIDVTYTANAQTGAITYVDREGNTIDTTPLTGKTDDNVTINPVAPAGWKIIAGQQIPTTVKATANGIQGPSILVEHDTTTVKPGDLPNPGDKKPGNPDKKPGDKTPKTDITYNDLHKAMTRTINVTDPHTGLKTTKVTLNYERTATIDDVTGKVTYGNWTVAEGSKAGFDGFNVPAVPGYTSEIKSGSAADLKALTPNQDQITNWTDQTVDIDYTANDQSLKITYVDKDDNPVDGGIFNVSGKTDQTVDTKAKIPAGWVLEDGQTDAPKTITFTGTPTADITIKIEHGKTSVDHTHPVKPGDKTPSGKEIKGAHDEDLNQTITRTVNITEPGQATKTTTQVAHIYRDATVDDVTGEVVTYSAWSTDSADWTAVNVPSHAGYTAHQSDGQTGIPVVTVKDGQKDVNIDVTYTPDEQKGQITYVDEKGNQISSTPLTGKTDEDIAINPVAPAGWELVPGQKYPATVTATADGISGVTLTVRHHMINVVPGDVPTPGDKKPGNNDKKPGDGTPNKDITHEDLNKTITRTFIVKAPTGTMTKTQHISYQRTATIDDVTGDVTFSDWNTDGASFKAEVIPAISGYTSHVTEGNYGAYAPSQDQINNWTDPMITVTYTANDQSQVINYVDDHNKTIKTDTVKGKTDETVKTNSEVPAGWVLVKGQHDAPATITFTGAHTDDITIKIEHGKTSVDHNHPVNPGDKTPSGKVIKGAHDEDLNQTITRTVNITEPGQATKTTTQVAHIYRDATVDDVTGEVTYSAWSTDSADWTAVNVPSHAGYTAHQSDGQTGIPVVTVKDGQKDQTVDITYTANEGTVLIKYVDRDGNEIGQQVITGHVGDTIKVTPQFPENWVPVDPDTVPAEVQIKEENGQIIIVVVRHDEKDPVQTKKVTRTIMVTTPDGQTKTIKQVVTISRHGSLDLVTGQIAWQPWTTAQWDVFKPAAIAGYIPSPAEVPAVTVDGETTDQTVDITYAAVATPAQQGHQAPTASDTPDAQQATNQKADSNAQPAVTVVTSQQTATAQQGHQAPTASDTPDAQQATNQKADSNAQPAVTVVTSQQTATAQQVESTTNSRRLPQTGNSHDASALAGLGLASLLMGLFGLGGKRRKRD